MYNIITNIRNILDWRLNVVRYRVTVSSLIRLADTMFLSELFDSDSDQELFEWLLLYKSSC